MRKYQRSLLSAVIAGVFLFVVGIALLIFNIVCIWLTNSGITFMGVPVVIIVLITFVYVVGVVDYIVLKSKISKAIFTFFKISNIIFTFILLGMAAYLVIYLMYAVSTYFLVIYLFRLLSLYCLL